MEKMDLSKDCAEISPTRRVAKKLPEQHTMISNAGRCRIAALVFSLLSSAIAVQSLRFIYTGLGYASILGKFMSFYSHICCVLLFETPG